MPSIDQSGLVRLLGDEFPTLEKKYKEQFALLFLELQKKCEGAEISSKALDLRGLLDALRRGREPSARHGHYQQGLRCLRAEPDPRQSVFDELTWLALENAAYEKELPVRPVLAELRRGHAEEFFASEYQLSRQEWMEKNQPVYSLQSARWKTVLSQKPPLLAPAR